MRRNEKGVTLVELLVVLAIMGIVLAPIIALTTSFLGTHAEVMGNNQLQHEARFIVEYIQRVVNEADEWSELEKDGKGQLKLRGQIVLWYDQAGQRILKGPEGSYVFSNHVHSDTKIELSSNRDKLDLHLILEDEAGHRYELKTTISKRDKKLNTS